MSNRYYEPGENRAARVRDLFGAIASRYDLINDLQSFGLHRWWKRKMIRLAAPGPGLPALDVCCGTGDITFALRQAGAEATGLDFSRPMLLEALKKLPANHSGAETRSSTPAHFVQGDAQHLPFPDATFEVVTVGYGLRNLPNWERGLTEMWRVARPGGKVLILDFGKPEHPAWRWIYFWYLRRIVPVFGWLFCDDSQAYSYILESLHHYPAQEGVSRRLQALGAAEVKLINLLGGMMSIHCARK